MSVKGTYHVSGSHQGLVINNPLGQLYTFASPSDHLFSRFPVRLSPWKNVIRVFQSSVWFFTFGGLFCFSSAFAFIYSCYKSIPTFNQMGLLNENKVTSYSDFFILVTFGIVEPNSLPWFSNKLSAGKGLILIWALTVQVLILSFNSNLYAEMTRPILEDPINTIDDAIERGEDIWVRHLVLNWTGDWNDPNNIDQVILRDLHPKLQTYITDIGSTYPVSRRLPNDIFRDVIDNGASVVLKSVS